MGFNIRSKLKKSDSSGQDVDQLLKPLIEGYLNDIDKNGGANFMSLEDFKDE